MSRSNNFVRENTQKDSPSAISNVKNICRNIFTIAAVSTMLFSTLPVPMTVAGEGDPSGLCAAAEIVVGPGIHAEYVSEGKGYNQLYGHGKEVEKDITTDGNKEVGFTEPHHGFEFATNVADYYNEIFAGMSFVPHGTDEEEKNTEWSLKSENFDGEKLSKVIFTLYVQVEKLTGNGYCAYDITVDGNGVWEIPKDLGNPLAIVIGNIRIITPEEPIYTCEVLSADRATKGNLTRFTVSEYTNNEDVTDIEYTLGFGDGTTVGPQNSRDFDYTHGETDSYTVSAAVNFIVDGEVVGSAECQKEFAVEDELFFICKELEVFFLDGEGNKKVLGEDFHSVMAEKALTFAVSADTNSGMTVKYTIDFGDGTVAGPQSSNEFTHAYADEGEYEVSVTVSFMFDDNSTLEYDYCGTTVTVFEEKKGGDDPDEPNTGYFQIPKVTGVAAGNGMGVGLLPLGLAATGVVLVRRSYKKAAERQA